MGNIFGGISGILFFIFSIIALLTPIWLYLTQKYTYQTRQEVRKSNKNLEKILILLEQQNELLIKNTSPPAEASTSKTVTMTCEHCGKTFRYGTNHSGTYQLCPGCKKKVLLK